MGAFKQFLSTDVIVAPLVVNKNFYFEGTASLINVGVIALAGINYNINSSNFIASASLNSSITSSISIGGVFNSVKQLYYTNYIPNPISGSPYITNYLGQVVEDDSKNDVYSRFYNYEQTSLFQTNSAGYTSNYGFERYFQSIPGGGFNMLSIPRNLFGDYINPNTFYLKLEGVNPGDFDTVTDNGEGILVSGSQVAGIINYSHGTIIFANNGVNININENLFGSNNITCSFQSSRTIYETQYKCTIRPEEFNFSLNPSLISGSTEGTVYNFVTSSYFAPYVSTVGFYNEAQELLMVAKLGQPLPTSRTTDTTILVNIDK
jgi:hypothetical protein